MNAMMAVREFTFKGELTRAGIIARLRGRWPGIKPGAFANAIQAMSGGRWQRRKVPGGKFLYSLRHGVQ